MFTWIMEATEVVVPSGIPGSMPGRAEPRGSSPPVPRAAPDADEVFTTGERAAGVPGDLLLPVSALVPRPPLLCAPQTSIREVACRMRTEQASAVLVDCADGPGIVTDADLRDKVLAGGMGPETPARAVMSRPVRTVTAEAPAYQAALTMASAGIRHLLVVDHEGERVGIVSADCFLTLDEHGPLALFRSVVDAVDEDAVAAAAGRLPGLFCTLVDVGLEAAAVSDVITGQHDAMTRRLIDLAVAELGPPPADFAWLALGSAARREMGLASDQDNALAYAGDEDPAIDAYYRELARRVNAGLARCGFAADSSGVLAETDMWRLSASSWRQVFEQCLRVPNTSHLIRATIAFDVRQVAGDLSIVPTLAELMRTAPRHAGFLASLAGTVTEIPSPLGLRRRLAGAVDLKKRGLVPIVNLARYFTLREGIVCTSTADRLAALAESEVLAEATVDGLAAAYATLARQRMVRHAELMREGREPSNVVAAEGLPRLRRAAVTEALRVVADAQRLLPPPLHGW